VLISSNNPNLYLNVAFLRIKYDVNIFGTNAIANGKVTVSKSDLFNNGDDYWLYMPYPGITPEPFEIFNIQLLQS
jgi:hypothetical protein